MVNKIQVDRFVCSVCKVEYSSEKYAIECEDSHRIKETCKHENLKYYLETSEDGYYSTFGVTQECMTCRKSKTLYFRDADEKKANFPKILWDIMNEDE